MSAPIKPPATGDVLAAEILRLTRRGWTRGETAKRLRVDKRAADEVRVAQARDAKRTVPRAGPACPQRSGPLTADLQAGWR